jgi:hypothetical protein
LPILIGMRHKLDTRVLSLAFLSLGSLTQCSGLLNIPALQSNSYQVSAGSELSLLRAGRCNLLRVTPLGALSSEFVILVSAASKLSQNSLSFYSDSECSAPALEFRRSALQESYGVYFVADAVGQHAVTVKSPQHPIGIDFQFNITQAPRVLSVRTELFGDAEATIRQVSRRVSFKDIVGGRNFSFALFEDGQKLSTLNCTSPERSFDSIGTQNGVVQVPLLEAHSKDTSDFFASQKVTLSCSAEGYEPVQIDLDYQNSNVETVSAPHSTQLAIGMTNVSTGGIAFAKDIVVFGTNSKSIQGTNQLIAKSIASGELMLVSGTRNGQPGNSVSYGPSITKDARYVAFSSDASNLVPGVSGNQIYLKDLKTGDISLVSASASNELGDGTSSGAVIDSEGRFVLFVSSSSNLLPGVSGLQIYKKNLSSSAITLVSSSSTGQPGAGSGSDSPSPTSDGRYVVFVSRSPNLIAGVSGSQIYLKDLDTGLLSLVSASSTNQTGNGSSGSPLLAADGSLCVFQSASTNLVPGVSGIQIYLKNLQSGAISVVSTSETNQVGNGPSNSPRVSLDGRYLVFSSTATNLVTGVSGNQVYLKDLATGAMTLVSATASGESGNGFSLSPVMSADLQSVAYFSNSTNFRSGVFGYQLYLKNLSTGDNVLMTTSSANQVGNGSSAARSISADGRYVAYQSDARNLLLGVSGTQIYLKDLNTGVNFLASASATGQMGNGISQRPFVSADGRFVAFESAATNLVPDASGNQIYLKNLNSGEIFLMSSSTDGLAGDGNSISPSLSGNGRYLSFKSNATNLISGVSGNQIYCKDVLTGAVTLVSSSASNQSGNGSSYGPATISGDGRLVAFESVSTNLIPGVSGNQIFLKDLESGSVTLVSASASNQMGNNTSNSPAISANGQFVAFRSRSTNFVSGVSFYQIYIKEIATGAISLVSASASGIAGGGAYSTPAISADGRFVAFASSSSSLIPGVNGYQIFLKDLSQLSVTLVSATNAGQPSNGDSDAPAISADGRYVTFVSDATNLNSGVTSNQTYRKRINIGLTIAP